MKSLHKKVIGIGLFLLVIITMRLMRIQNYINIDYIQMYYKDLQQYVNEYYYFSALAFIGITLTVVLFAIPLSPILTMVSGALFGSIRGAFFSMLGSTLGALASFLIFRYLLQDIIQRKYAKSLQNFNQEVQKSGAYYLLFLQLLPVTPFSVITALAGLSLISIWTFVWTTFVGIAPGSFIYAFAGKQLMDVEGIEDIFSWPFVAVLFLLAGCALLPIIINKIHIYKGIQH